MDWFPFFHRNTGGTAAGQVAPFTPIDKAAISIFFRIGMTAFVVPIKTHTCTVLLELHVLYVAEKGIYNYFSKLGLICQSVYTFHHF